MTFHAPSFSSFRPDSFHRNLAAFNARRLSPSLGHCSQEDVREAHAFHALELDWIERERAGLEERVADVPTNADDFVRWFEALAVNGPGQADPLFPWIAAHATRADLRWFLRQEMAGEVGFGDLVALTQVKMPKQAKLELARNYWDEMGQGHMNGMHGGMLTRLAEELAIDDAEIELAWEPLALGNLMVAFANNRCLAYQSIGALGVIELTAPGRAACVNAGLKRLGVDGEARRYFALHATLDVRHSERWNREVLAPLVAERPECARAIAEGALLRLEAGARCFERYREELGFERRQRCAG